MSGGAPSAPAPRDDRPGLDDRLAELFRDARAVTDRFRELRRGHAWHPFIAANYERVLATLRDLYRPGMRFLEWGSANGAITIAADLLGYDAAGIEIDPDLVDLARELAARHGSTARFAAGSFLPDDYTWRAADGDSRLGTIAHGHAGYRGIGRDLADFDIVFGYPWSGEDLVMLDLMRQRGGPDARLLLAGGPDGAVRVYTQDDLARASGTGGPP